MVFLYCQPVHGSATNTRILAAIATLGDIFSALGQQEAVTGVTERCLTLTEGPGIPRRGVSAESNLLGQRLGLRAAVGAGIGGGKVGAGFGVVQHDLAPAHGTRILSPDDKVVAPLPELFHDVRLHS
jgi:hypothetical protein